MLYIIYIYIIQGIYRICGLRRGRTICTKFVYDLTTSRDSHKTNNRVNQLPTHTHYRAQAYTYTYIYYYGCHYARGFERITIDICRWLAVGPPKAKIQNRVFAAASIVVIASYIGSKQVAGTRLYFHRSCFAFFILFIFFYLVYLLYTRSSTAHTRTYTTIIRAYTWTFITDIYILE